MSLLFIDCETCGLPVSSNRNIPAKQTYNWPHIVQMSWILQNEDGEHMNTGDLIIRPSGYEISEESTKIHGISHQQAVNEGIHICDALRILERDIVRCSAIVCHNTAFDLKVLQASFYRCKMKSVIDTKRHICTMQHPAVIKFCAIPFATPSKYPGSKRGFKWPRLTELYQKCFNMNFPNAHNSLFDVRATRECYNYLIENNIISN
jgi:DNA polymerase III epsilon subunit-like protein